MLYLFAVQYAVWLEAHGLGFFRVFKFVSFQASIAVLISFMMVVLSGSSIIARLRRLKVGDVAQFDQEKINELMKGKKGTPTMGGIMIIGSILLTTLLIADLSNFYVDMALICLLWLGAVGSADDWLKLTAARRPGGSRQGLTGAEKLMFQIGLAFILSYFTYRYGRQIPEATRCYFPFTRESLELSLPLYIILGTFVLTGTSNAVNLTDGLDGLAAGCMAIASFAFLLLCLIIGDRVLATQLLFVPIVPSGQMAVIAGAMLGACLGFLWFNCHPAQVFMGDTGSLALGGLIGYIAIVIRQELLLFLIGGIFVVEAISVMLQISFFKYTRKRTGVGKRIFLVAPLHHHFQHKGWTETQVVIRFWLIGAMLAAMGLATIKLR